MASKFSSDPALYDVAVFVASAMMTEFEPLDFRVKGIPEAERLLRCIARNLLPSGRKYVYTVAYGGLLYTSENLEISEISDDLNNLAYIRNWSSNG